MRARPRQKLNVRQFLTIHEGSEDKVELIDGEVWLMAGGSQRHADVSINLIGALYAKLRGTGCRPYNSDMGLFLDFENMRYPDVMIACDRRDLDQDRAKSQFVRHPAAVFKVLSPSTEGDDSRFKIEQYKVHLPSLRLAALVHPVEETVTGFVREQDGPWTPLDLPRGADLVIPEPALTITAAEIFAR